jgi:hypothetical protein
MIVVMPLLSSKSLADGYWGLDAQGSWTYTIAPSYCWGNKYSDDFFTPSSDVAVDSLFIWCNGQNNYPKVVFGIYDVIAGVISNRVAVSDSLSISGNTMQRWGLKAGIDLESGTTYTICVDIVGAGGPAVAYDIQTSALSRTSNSTFPAVWSDDNQLNARYSVAAHYRDTPAGTTDTRRRAILMGE